MEDYTGQTYARLPQYCTN